MRVIFLDVDGCINHYKTKEYLRIEPFDYRGIDDTLVKRLAKIVKYTRAKIVLISDWGVFGGNSMHMLYLKDKLSKNGLNIYDIIDWNQYRTNMRAEAIIEWLKEHPKVKHYAIIDDTIFWGYDNPIINKHWFYCTSGDGWDNIPPELCGITRRMTKVIIKHLWGLYPMKRCYQEPGIAIWFHEKD